jgi:peptidoglycan/xylan/chitin deacetylase (PgdA/CDA1 family)
MSWEQIREMRDAGVAIGSQTHTHLHMATSPHIRNVADIAESNRRFVEELGTAPTLFAYPYGEMSLDARATIIESGFLAAFGQHSGVAHRTADQYFLPRFAFNENYGSIDRLRTAANALPLPVQDITPADPLLTQNPPNFGFSVAVTIDKLDQLTCYNSQQGRLNIERLGASRIELRFGKALPQGRSRINCTMPERDGRWRWFGRQFFVDLD